MMGWHGYPGFDWTSILFVVVITAMLVWGFRSGVGKHFRSGRKRSSSRSALDIAKERYARGEISRDEFLDIANDLYLTDSTIHKNVKGVKDEFPT